MAQMVCMVGIKMYRNSKDDLYKKRKQLRKKLKGSKSYYEWSIHMAKLDALDGFHEKEKVALENQLYDRNLLQDKIMHLRRVRESSRGGVGALEQMYAVRTDLVRNLGNMANSALSEHFPIVPGPIREYIDEVRLHLEQITYSPDVSLRDKSAFLRETRHAFGRTALVLSGGGALGAFHLGVVKALLEHRMLPRVLAGSKSGAIVCALAATRTDSELLSLLENLDSVDLSFFTTATVLQHALHALAGAPQRPDLMRKRLRHLLGDLTFLEAYMYTGRVFNISIYERSDQASRLLNYLTAPHVLIWSAVACSLGFVGTNQSRELLIRGPDGSILSVSGNRLHSTEVSSSGFSSMAEFWKGGYVDDELPMKKLSEMFSVNHFIVSQTTPHIAPFLSAKRKLGKLGHLIESEIKHRCRQAAELVPRWAPRGLLKRLSEPWEGDVTIVLPETVLQLTKTIIPATQEDLRTVVRQGELCTWSKMSAVQCNCGIEVTLDACLRQVSTWERQNSVHQHSRAASYDLGKHSMIRSISTDSLYKNNNAVADVQVWQADEEHLPLPEEMISSPQVSDLESIKHQRIPDAAYECVDTSVANFDVSKPRVPKSASFQRNSLDFIAP